jgi:hypothetical protein
MAQQTMIGKRVHTTPLAVTGVLARSIGSVEITVIASGSMSMFGPEATQLRIWGVGGSNPSERANKINGFMNLAR